MIGKPPVPHALVEPVVCAAGGHGSFRVDAVVLAQVEVHGLHDHPWVLDGEVLGEGRGGDEREVFGHVPQHLLRHVLPDRYCRLQTLSCRTGRVDLAIVRFDWLRKTEAEVPNPASGNGQYLVTGNEEKVVESDTYGG